VNTTYINKNKWFWAWQDEKEEAWLSEMAREGLHLEAVSLGRYKFQKGEPADYVYRLDYQSLRSKDKESYLQLFEDTGWEHVGEMSGWRYFRIQAGEGEVPEIFRDAESKMGKYQRVMIYLVIFLPIMLMLVMSMPIADGRYGILSVVAEAFFAVLLLLYSVAMVQLFRRMNQVKGKKGK